MSNTSQFVKKAVSIAVTSATIVWSVGAATFAPIATHAATPGSLIKMAGNSSVYYLGSDNKRYVFPNSTTYFTWYPDFSGVQTISQSELQGYAIGGNVTMRPGTKLAKITTDPKVYAIEPGGTLRWVQTEAIAKALFGDNWAQRVVDVPDAFFVNYKPGTDITSNTYPTGSLIKSSSSSDIYYVDGSSKRKVQAGGMTGNMFNAANVLTASDSVFNALSTGTDITATDTTIWNVSGGAGVGPGVGQGSGLTVALASDTPASGIQSAPTAYNPALKINLTASADGPVNVTGITLTRQGVTPDSAIAGVGIYDASGHRHGNVVTFGNSMALVTFTSDPIVVSAGQTVSVWAKTNINASVVSGTYALSVAKASDIKTTATVNGTFPVQGNGFSLISGIGSIATLTIQAQTQSGGTAAAPTQVDQGTTNINVTKFAIAETSGQEDAKLTRLTITNNGSASDSDYMNIRLVDQNGATVATVQNAVSGRIFFDLSASPVVIPKGQTRYYTVEVDTASNTNSAGRTIDLTVQNDYDLEAYGANSGAGILPTAGGLNQFPIGDGIDINNAVQTGEVSNYMVFKTGTLSISKSSNSPSGKVAPGAVNQTLASFDIQAFGEPVEIQKVNFVITKDGTNELTTGMHALTGTLRIEDANNGIIFSQSANTTTLYSADGTFSLSNAVVTNTGAGAAAGTLTTLNSYMTVNPGTTGKLVFVGDISQSATTTDTYEVLITSVYARRISSNNFVTISSTVQGNQIQVDTTSLTVSKNSSYNPVNLVGGTSNLKIGSFNIQAGPAEAVNVTTMTATVGSSASSTIDFTTGAPLYASGTTTGVSNIKLMIGSTQFGSTISSPTAVTGDSFSGTANVPASGTVTVDVYADVSSAFTANDYIGAKLAVTAAVGQSSQTNITASAQTGQSVQVKGGGTLLLQSDSSDAPIQQIVHANQIDVPVLALKVSENSNAEDLTLNKLFFAATNGSGNYQDLKLFGPTALCPGNGSDVPAGQCGQTVQLVSGEARFTSLNLSVKKGSSPTVLWLKATSTGSGVQTPGQQSFFAPSYFEYVGASSGKTTRASGGVVSVSANSTTLTVNDSSQFVSGQKVAIDLNDNGSIPTSSNGENNSLAGFTITGIPSSTTLTLNTAANATAGGRVVVYDTSVTPNLNDLLFQSNTMINHNSEPVVTASSASTGTPGTSGQPIGTFTISNQGSRDISVSGFEVTFAGSFTACTSAGGITGVALWQNNTAKVTTPHKNHGAAGTSSTCFSNGDIASFDVNPAITVSSNSSTDFVIKGNTTATNAGVSGGSHVTYGVVVNGVQGGGQLLGGGAAVDTTKALGGVRWDYQDVNGLYGSTATTTPGTVPDYTTANASTGQVMDVSDSIYPVSGPTSTF